jgi:hypothetical protein
MKEFLGASETEEFLDGTHDCAISETEEFVGREDNCSSAPTEGLCIASGCGKGSECGGGEGREGCGGFVVNFCNFCVALFNHCF